MLWLIAVLCFLCLFFWLCSPCLEVSPVQGLFSALWSAYYTDLHQSSPHMANIKERNIQWWADKSTVWETVTQLHAASERSSGLPGCVRSSRTASGAVSRLFFIACCAPSDSPPFKKNLHFRQHWRIRRLQDWDNVPGYDQFLMARVSQYQAGTADKRWMIVHA